MSTVVASHSKSAMTAYGNLCNGFPQRDDLMVDFKSRQTSNHSAVSISFQMTSMPFEVGPEVSFFVMLVSRVFIEMCLKLDSLL